MSHPLLTAPIGRSLLRLAGPTTGLMVVQILVAAVDVYFIGQLGVDALAAIALVFPFQMLMMNIAMGGMGGSVAASMARALGAGRLDDARASSCTRWSSPWRADWSSPASPGRWRPGSTR